MTGQLRNVANRVGVTERAAQRIVSDLVDAGYLGPALTVLDARHGVGESA